jgi:hypothetical protein
VKQAELRRWERYFEARNMGLSIEAAARKGPISPSTAYRFERSDPTSGGLEAAAILGVSVVAGNLVAQPLSKEATRALEDFAYFRLRYFGRKSTPWQERAAYDVLRAIETTDREYVVINCPPGSGKSTLFTHDIACWLIARDRTIRIMIGSRTERQARMYVGRIKRSLERDAPLRADMDSVEAGVAFDAVACLQDDYGAFRPEGRSELWRAESLVVRQTDGVSLDDKEPTVSAWGMDSGFLGGRFDFVLWDDLIDKRNTRTVEAREALIEWFVTEAETRVEPGGAFILQGQRMSPTDLYRHCLDAVTIDETPKYRHIKYQAHDDERCKDEHGPEAKAWPDGCLLDPHRLPWRFLQTVKANSPRTFDVQYQQNDGTGTGGLVLQEWIEGGTDQFGYPAPGCLDRDRGNVVPIHLVNNIDAWSTITVDPSPTEWWGVIWHVYDAPGETDHIISVHRRRMGAEEFLSLDYDTGEFSGLLEDLRLESNRQGAPITHVIFEINAAQRWFVTQPLVQKWMQVTGIVVVPHTTTINKQDPKFGVESIGDMFRQGRCRIPWGTPAARLTSNDLVKELVSYPEGDTSDLVMSMWFQTLGIRNIYTPRQRRLYAREVPTWVSRGANGQPIQRGLTYAR